MKLQNLSQVGDRNSMEEIISMKVLIGDMQSSFPSTPAAKAGDAAAQALCRNVCAAAAPAQQKAVVGAGSLQEWVLVLSLQPFLLRSLTFLPLLFLMNGNREHSIRSLSSI